MPTFSQGDIVRVPFSYTDRNPRQHRPAMVVSRGPVGDDGALLWVAMITSAQNRPWPGDCTIEAYEQAGLPILSVVRTAKIPTIEARDAGFVGRLPAEVTDRVLGTVAGWLGC